MKVLVQQQIRIAYEFLTVDCAQDSIRPSRRAHAPMSARISRALNDDNPTDGLTEHALECHGHWLRQYKATPEERSRHEPQG
jgi:hypothetical protein